MNVLTKEISEQFLANESSVAISEFTAIEDNAAESLCGYGGKLNIDLDELPESAADILSKHPSFAIEY